MLSIDDPQVNDVVFHPRPEGPGAPAGAVSTETAVDGALIGGYLHRSENSDTLMLFFHGNGEIAADYGALAHLYTGSGVSFWVVDYRGYGRSTGSPTFLRMLADAESILEDIPAVEAAARMRFSRLIVMGRSLGSAPALHLAAGFSVRVDGLVLDSPFADAPGLIRRLGGPEIDTAPRSGFVDNLERAKACRMPTLILHGTEDRIIPVSEAEALHEAIPSTQKRLVKIRGAGHNDLLVQGLGTYFSEIRSLCDRIE